MSTAGPRRASRQTTSAGLPAASDGRFAHAEGSGYASHEARLSSLSSSYLGGAKFWPRSFSSKAAIHSAVMDGVPYASLIILVGKLKALDLSDVVKVLGISTRTLRRRIETPHKVMPPHLASKAWLFAETLAKVTEVIGGKEDGERWMSKRAVGLGGQRPIDMMRTFQGTEVMSDFLTRLQYGVYS